MNELEISKKIKEYRLSRELSVKDLANLTGVTSSLLSQIEKGTANPSINTLKQVSKALNIPMYKFFISDDTTQDLVVRKENRKKIIFQEEDSFAYELLTANSQGAIEFMMMKIPSHKASSKEFFKHKGEEVAYVMKGVATLYLMDKIIELNSGDSVRIPPYSEHRWENREDEECHVIFAVTPPSF